MKVFRMFPLVAVVVALLAWPGLAQTKTHNIALSWIAGTGDATFNVYRSTTTGTGYTKIGSSPTTTFTDSSGVGGTKYFYVVTGVDSGGFESVNSNEASGTFLALPAAPVSLAATAQ